MNPNPEWRTVRIGLLSAAALVLLALGIMGITSKQKIFERKVEYYSAFPDAAGLKEGSGVWFQGVEVGFISAIEFSSDADVPKIIVRYRITASLVPRIRTGTRASIKSLGLLGDKYLSLSNTGQVGNQSSILPGNAIPVDATLNLEALGRGAQDVLDNTVSIARSLKDLVESLNSGKGTIPRLIRDPEYGQDTLNHIRSLSDNLDRISQSVVQGRGLGGRLLMDQEYGDRNAAELAQALAAANELLQAARDGRGGVGALLSKGGDGEKVFANLAAASGSLREIAESMNRPGTLSNRMLMDPVYGDHLAQNLLSISDSLASILKKVDEGKGTVGALVNDRDVYDSLASISRSLKESRLVRWYLKRNAEKAAKKARAEDKANGIPVEEVP